MTRYAAEFREKQAFRDAQARYERGHRPDEYA